jgi:outer membrane protein with beta-barrel domain
MTIRRLAVLSIVCILALPSAARAVYVGAAVGQATTEDDVGNVHFKDDTTGWKIYGGFRFLKFLGVEGSYVDLGSPSDGASGVTWEADAKAYDLFAVGVIPIGPFEVFGKWGVVATDTDVNVDAGFGNIESSSTETDMAYGVGAAWVFGEHIGVRVEYEKFEAGDIDDLFMYSAGVDFRF